MPEERKLPDSETMDLSPSKETYRSIQSDVSPVGAIKELIDNALDNWERVHGRQTDLDIDITYDPSEDLFEITDNSGGLEEDQIGKLFALGESTKETVNTPIGAYGVGAKKAIVKLGRNAELRSRYKEQEFGYGFSISEEWIEKPEDWEVEKRPYTDMEAGTTTISITDLALDLDEAGEEMDVDASGIDTEQFIDGLRHQLSQTYEVFLQSSPDFTGHLSISLNGEEVRVPEPIDWSFTPFDGFHPRSYENITLRRHNLDHDVSITIQVGLMATANEDEAGTDIFCQNRKVITGNTDAKGGYNTEHTENVGEVGPSRGRLKVRLFFKTTGDAERLPWDTQKNDIDEYDSLMQEVYEEWFDSIVEPYWRAARYSTFPAAFLQPYSSTGEWQANNGHLYEFDYRGRQRVNDKPNRDYDDKDWLEQTIDTHVEAGITAPHLVDERFRPTYREIVNDTNVAEVEEVALNKLVPVPDCPADTSDKELADTIEEVRATAQEDANRGRRQNFSDEWWVPVYKAYLRHYADYDSLTSVASNDGVESVESEEDDPANEKTPARGDTTESENSDSDSQATLGSHQESQTDSEVTEDETDGETPRETQTTGHTTTEDASETISSDTDSSDSSDSSESENDNNTSQEIPESSQNSQGPDDLKGHRQSKPDKKTVVLDFDLDDWQQLCAYLGVDSDSDIEEDVEPELKRVILSELLDN
ncbi:ATP-binding protein [Haloarcula salinisoli]|uniref:ATP-binding protein n=1 Tax=Haloarcula salinisoli TaxID=2487746 RepID=A0A8J7YH92_9EURY|nr:ATP-binding protein [Halomicroarcula salinisoli]MBX0305482.1 ATP-binding protein [Halomicroarcula salinisoli]